jgi:plastocyanin
MQSKWQSALFVAALAITFTGCGGDKPAPESSTAPAGAPAGGGAAVDATTAGSVSGSVNLDGPAPTFKAINMSAEPFCSKAHTSAVMPEDVVTGDKGALANVVVYVKDDMSKYSFDTPKSPVTLNQQGCMYSPHVVALMAGQTIEVKNDDQTTHNIHPTPKDNREWNQSQPPGAAPLDETFARGEVAIPVKCNVHPWMKGYIAVFKHPFFAVTTKDGKFELKGLPPGTYTIEAWQEKLGVVDQQVTIGPKDSKTVSFTFKAAGATGD